MKHHYEVSYLVKLPTVGNGEYSNDQTNKVLTYISMSDDLGEVFIDLVDVHRDDYIIGLEILSIEALDGDVSLVGNELFFVS